MKAGFILRKHYLHNIQVDVIDDTTARCQCYFQTITTKPDGSKMVIGRFDDTITLEEGEWKLLTKRNILQGAIPLPPPLDEFAGVRLNPQA